MAKMQIAFYKGEQTLSGMFQDLLKDPGIFVAHVAICIRTLSKYSHAELVIDGKCWSSSERDNGVRGKVINLDSGHWDVYPVAWQFDDPDKALTWFLDHDGAHYDWLGILRFVLPFVKQKDNEYFCSEAIAAALGVTDTYKLTPKDLLRFVVRT
jgi:uncharacterized protein YycO